MASIHKDFSIDAPAHEVWDALRDFGALHTRLASGFVTDCRLEGEARVVTFANGTTARELLVDCDDARRRLVYAVISDRVKQHSASAQVIPEGETHCRFVWITDVLPHDIAPYVSSQMDAGLAAIQKALSRTKAAV
ncbi:MAG TPA: SRPBCC family protein [Bradyrhizobium sp.]|nr:SRPBCC family protein [Bradyrhizobium sp.]